MKMTLTRTQILATFIVSATVALLSALLCLTLYSDYALDHSNPFDNVWRRILCDPVQRLIGRKRANATSHVLFSLLVAISDQQTVVGIALLGAAIHALQNQSITVYHFNIIMDMAWFSSNVHLLTLCILRSFLESPRLSNVLSVSRSHGPLQRLLRIMAMVVLAALLLHCSAIAGFEGWDNAVNCSAQCITKGKRRGAPHRQMIVTYIFVIQSYTVQIVRVTPSIQKFFANHLMPWIERLDNKACGRKEEDDSASTRSKLQKPIDVAYGSIRKTVIVLWYFFTSDFEFMIEMIAWYGLGLYWTFSDRKAGRRHMDTSEMSKENHIGFGQLVPLLLIVLATLAAMESFTCKPLSSNISEILTKKVEIHTERKNGRLDREIRR
jgi:hypothetical protein